MKSIKELNDSQKQKITHYIFLAKCALINKSDLIKKEAIETLSHKISHHFFKRDLADILKIEIAKKLENTDEDLSDYLLAFLIACSKVKNQPSLALLGKIKKIIENFELRFNKSTTEEIEEFFLTENSDAKVVKFTLPNKKNMVGVWENIYEALDIYDDNEKTKAAHLQTTIASNNNAAKDLGVLPNNGYSMMALLLLIIYIDISAQKNPQFRAHDLFIFYQFFSGLFMGMSAVGIVWQLNGIRIQKIAAQEKKIGAEIAKKNIEDVFTDLFPSELDKIETMIHGKAEVNDSSNVTPSTPQTTITPYFLDFALFDYRKKKPNNSRKSKQIPEIEKIEVDDNSDSTSEPEHTWFDGKISSKHHCEKLIPIPGLDHAFLLLNIPELEEQADDKSDLESLLKLVRDEPTFVKAVGHSGIVKTGPYTINLKIKSTIAKPSQKHTNKAEDHFTTPCRYKVKKCGQKSRILLAEQDTDQSLAAHAAKNKTQPPVPNVRLYLATSYVKKHMPTTDVLTAALDLDKLGIKPKSEYHGKIGFWIGTSPSSSPVVSNIDSKKTDEKQGSLIKYNQ